MLSLPELNTPEEATAPVFGSTENRSNAPFSNGAVGYGSRTAISFILVSTFSFCICHLDGLDT